MCVIYYNVSGEIMEILQFLISFFINEFGGGKLKPILDALEQNSFDVVSTLKNLNPQTIMPILKELFSAFVNNNSPTETVGESVSLNPIVDVADKQIVYSLNKYFCSI